MLLLIFLLSVCQQAKYDVPNCFRYKSLVYNAPCIQCKYGFQLIKQDNYCQQCKDGLKDVNGKCQVDYSYKDPSLIKVKNGLTEQVIPTSSQTQFQILNSEPMDKNANDNGCLKRDEDRKCLGCRQNYEPTKNNTCRPTKIDPSQNCDKFNKSDKKCERCVKGFSFNNFGICEQLSQKDKQKVPQFCIDYFNGICYACQLPYLIDKINKKCIKLVSSSHEKEEEKQSLSPNSTNGTNLTRQEEFMDENCISFSQNGNYCQQCAYFFYFDEKFMKCEVVSPFCKTYSQKTGECRSCFWGFKLIKGKCELNF